MARPSNPSVLAAPEHPAQSESSNPDPLCEFPAEKRSESVSTAPETGEAQQASSTEPQQPGSVPPPSATVTNDRSNLPAASLVSESGETSKDEISKVIHAQQPSALTSSAQPRKVATPPRPSPQASAKPRAEAAPKPRTTTVGGDSKSSRPPPPSSRAQAVAPKPKDPKPKDPSADFSEASEPRVAASPIRRDAAARKTLVGISPLPPVLEQHLSAAASELTSVASTSPSAGSASTPEADATTAESERTLTQTVAAKAEADATQAVAATAASDEKQTSTQAVAPKPDEDATQSDATQVVTATAASDEKQTSTQAVAPKPEEDATQAVATQVVTATAASDEKQTSTQAVAARAELTSKRMPPRPSSTPTKAQAGAVARKTARPEPTAKASSTSNTARNAARNLTIRTEAAPIASVAAVGTATTASTATSFQDDVSQPVPVAAKAPEAPAAPQPPASSSEGQSVDAPEGETTSGASPEQASAASTPETSKCSGDSEIPIEFDGFELPSEPTQPELFPNLDDGFGGSEPNDREQDSSPNADSEPSIEQKNDLPTCPWNEIPESFQDGNPSVEIPLDSPTKPWNGPPPSGAFEIGSRAIPPATKQPNGNESSKEAPTTPSNEPSPSDSFESGPSSPSREQPLIEASPALVEPGDPALNPGQTPDRVSERPKGPPPLPPSMPRPAPPTSVEVVTQSAVPHDAYQARASVGLSTPIPKLRPSISLRKVLLTVVALAAAGVTVVFLMSSPSRPELGARAAKSATKPQKSVPAAAVPSAVVRHTTDTGATTVSKATPEKPAAPDEDTVDIAINIKPDGSTFYYKGKMLGKTPFVLKHPRGEKLAYDVGKMGYAARQVIINGTNKSIRFSLTKEAARHSK